MLSSETRKRRAPTETKEKNKASNYKKICITISHSLNYCSVTSIKSGSEKLHRRGSSLGNQQEILHLQSETKQQPFNRSSPEIDVGEQAKMQPGEKDKESQRNGRKSEDAASVTSESNSLPVKTPGGVSFHISGGGEGSSSDNKDILGKNSENNVFLEGSTIEEVDEVATPSYKTSPPQAPHSLSSVNGSEDISVPATREERAGTMQSDMSGSCSTLQNERPEGEIESSLEQSRKQQQQMSVRFRQELLSVSQVKTESRVGLEVAKLTESDFDLVQLLDRSLPHIVPTVPISKREVGMVKSCDVRSSDLCVGNPSKISP